MHKQLVITAAILGLLAVVLGAFGAHSLKPHLTADQLESYLTGSRYHFFHVLAALFAGYVWKGNKWFAYAGYAFIIGVFLFSGSIYLLATRQLLGIEGMTGILGPITPIGGLFFLIGWALIAVGAWKSE